jgi:branched-subunit amino acid transport protein
MNGTILTVIIGGAIVNYLIRVAPVTLSKGRKMPEVLATFLNIMPVAALGALIFPGIIEAFPGNPFAGIAGIAVAALVSYLADGLVFPVIAAIAASWLAMRLF